MEPSNETSSQLAELLSGQTAEEAQDSTGEVIATTRASRPSAPSTKYSREMSSLTGAAGEAVLEAKGLSKTFGATRALGGVNLTVRKGTIHGFIGPNGAGKTTTFSIVAGFLQPDAGEVRIGGEVPHGAAGRRGILGILPQDARLPARDTVGEALTFYARLQGMNKASAMEEAHRCLKRVAMEGAWDKKCSTLSHGMQKRVGIAQAILGTPQLVLLDEPTAGLDPAIAHQVRELIVGLKNSGMSVLVSSHNLSELEAMCDAATILERGRVQADGTLESLTSAKSEVRVQVAADDIPQKELLELWSVHALSFDRSSRVITFTLSAGLSSPEAGIAEILKCLLARNVPISGLTKGRGLEAKVIALGNKSPGAH